MLCTEEDRQAAKATRMKKHLGSTKRRAMAYSQSGCVCRAQQAASEPDFSPLMELKKQVAALQSQLTSLMAKKREPSSLRENCRTTRVRHQNLTIQEQ